MDISKHDCPLCNITTALSITKFKARFNVQDIKTFLVAPRVDERRGVYMDNIYMYAGEQRTVHVMVTADTDDFEIIDPKYQIIYQDEVIDEGPVFGSKEPEPEEPSEPEPTEPEEPIEPATQSEPEPEPELTHDPHELIITMNPKTEGKYTLVVDFWVANEHIIRSHNIYVRKTK